MDQEFFKLLEQQLEAVCLGESCRNSPTPYVASHLSADSGQPTSWPDAEWIHAIQFSDSHQRSSKDIVVEILLDFKACAKLDLANTWRDVCL